MRLSPSESCSDIRSGKVVDKDCWDCNGDSARLSIDGSRVAVAGGAANWGEGRSRKEFGSVGAKWLGFMVGEKEHWMSGWRARAGECAAEESALLGADGKCRATVEEVALALGRSHE